MDPLSQLLAGRTNDEILQMLDAFPFEPEQKLALALMTLQGPGDVFEILKPLAQQCPPGSFARFVFKEFGEMSKEKLDDELREAMSDDGRSMAEVLSYLSPEMRRRKYMAGLLIGAETHQEELGQMMCDSDYRLHCMRLRHLCATACCQRCEQMYPTEMGAARIMRIDAGQWQKTGPRRRPAR